MHETGIVRDLVRKVEQAARDAGAIRVERIAVWLGALSQFSPLHFRVHFDDESRGTLAEGATLAIEVSGDPGDPNAQSVVIRGIELQVPEQAA
jgi:hydrogenase nickel incorporation protein HypA/HybF